MTTTPEQLSEETHAMLRARVWLGARRLDVKRPIHSHAVFPCDSPGKYCPGGPYCTAASSDGYEPKHLVTA